MEIVISALRPLHSTPFYRSPRYRYDEYLTQLDSLVGKSASTAGDRAGDDRAGTREARDDAAVRESLVRLDELWKTLMNSLGFVLPILKEVRGAFFCPLLRESDLREVLVTTHAQGEKELRIRSNWWLL